MAERSFLILHGLAYDGDPGHWHARLAGSLRDRLRTYQRCDSWRLDPSRLEEMSSLARGERRNLIHLRDFLLGAVCADCGVDEFALLEFDHRGSKEGLVFEMARRGSSIERLKREMASCEVRCANCHRRRTITELRAAPASTRKLLDAPVA